MQAYMKSAMPYHGVSTPERRKIIAEVFREIAFAHAREWEAEVRGLWRGAKFREERYAALTLTEHKSAQAFQTPAAMPLYEELIVSGAWWDYVDGLASHQVGGILREYPKEMKAMMRQWSKDADRWKRRTAIISQLGFKKETDLKLLYDCIEPSLDSKEFFLRKAIGWALRQYAWTDPKEIVRYVCENEKRLSGLSKREALKNIT